MPQVLADPGQTSGIILNGGIDLFAYPSTQAASIISLQTDPTAPLPPGTSTAVNLLNPPLSVTDQLRNFPPTVYDLAPTSVLVHFMQALLGAAGTGQLRNRQLIARLQQDVTSTHFYDLDSFYGALFGATRGPAGSLPVNPSTGNPVNPYTELASPDGWDEIETIDAVFRERVIALARAITLGATAPGMQALAEAITGVPCQVYEMWRLVTDPLSPAPGFNTWAEVMSTYANWDSIPATETWQGIEGVVTYSGLLGNGAMNEVVIRPRKTYSGSAADQAQLGSDMYGILSVVEVLKPAASIISVDMTGPGIVIPVPVSAAWSDSEYWELTQLVTPPSDDAAYDMALAAYQRRGRTPGPTIQTPVPPLSRSQGSQYSYSGNVTTVTARAVTGDDPNTAVVTDGTDWQTVVFPVGRKVTYLPPQAIMPPPQAASARTSSPVTVKSAPYSGPRVPIMRAS
jgi:hypothetical protein